MLRTETKWLPILTIPLNKPDPSAHPLTAVKLTLIDPMSNSSQAIGGPKLTDAKERDKGDRGGGDKDNKDGKGGDIDRVNMIVVTEVLLAL